jgi:lipopolysaccharide transport system permease protein
MGMDPPLGGHGRTRHAIRASNDRHRKPSMKETVIRPSRGWGAPNLAELWRSRDLIRFFVMRDVKVRYRQTFFGAIWAVVPPLFTMLIFTFVFTRVVSVPSDGMPYWAFSLCALTPWSYFVQALPATANSIVGSVGMVSKVYFPRLVLPVTAALSPLVDLCVAFVFLLIALTAAGLLPGPRLIFVVPFTLLAVITVLGVGSLFAAINVLYRDVKHVVPLATQLWLFATPVVYPSSLLPESVRPLIGLNPMAGVVEGYRWALLGVDNDPWPIIGVSAVSALVLLVFSLFVFRRIERIFADVI